MDVLTLNCHSWQEENQIEKIKYLAKTIQEKKYDVIALQEVSQSMEAEHVYGDNKRDNYGIVLLDELKKLGVVDYQMVWGFSHLGFATFEEGLAVLTKCPIIKERSFFVSESEDTNNWKTRKIVSATISYKDQPITIYSCHLGWWDDEEEPFQKQVDRLMGQVNNQELSFLMGDFNNNAHLRGAGYDYLMQQGLYDTYELAKQKDDGTTVKGKIAGWKENKQDLRIDFVLSNQAIEVISSQVIFNDINYRVISDHFGVEAKLNI
ncbi:maltose 6'-phosphate phosphatase [Marininema mesophilum]|uniref:Maltose 6'-phosphate phosphatase n=1 Tax=Marininema mesophilum TaxID=1048340 RepID=A0A1H2VEA9_9BACL|nr:endonuclease/exonuclease/phosphatase family protein [Marininema mesophilum]SDW66550.1 maltose 6'-phosphate phosphatase [Marininema mesophilum]